MSDFGIVTDQDRQDKELDRAAALFRSASARLAALKALHWETADRQCVECDQRWPCKTFRIVTGQP